MNMTLTDNGPDKHNKEGEKFDSYGTYPWGGTVPIHVTSVSYLLRAFRCYPNPTIQNSSHDLGWIRIWFWILLSNYKLPNDSLEKS